MRRIVVIILLAFTGLLSRAQCDSIAKLCAKHFAPTFISDGQQYRSLLLNHEEYSEFHATFFGETTYRISGCSGTSDGNLIFNIYDQDRHLLFSNHHSQNMPYWDFKVHSTLEVIIEAKLDPMKNAGSGCAVILIGFRQP